MSKPSLVRARENWHARYQGKKQIDVGRVFKVGRNCPLRDKYPAEKSGLVRRFFRVRCISAFVAYTAFEFGQPQGLPSPKPKRSLPHDRRLKDQRAGVLLLLH